ncbi:MAG: carboxypeptidase regulatory-like domain-containing protein [Bryobacteraceae bacterium]
MRIIALVAVAVLLAGCGGVPAEKKSAEATPEYFQVDAATAGSISGKVTFTGKKPALRKILMEDEEECLKAHDGKAPVDPSVTVNAGGALANVIVYVKSGLEGKNFAPVQAPVSFDQRGCMFVPRVLGIRVNQPLKVTNSDPVTHNVHPMPRVNREWNQGQPAGADPVERQFSQQEAVFPVKCNVHAWMKAYFLVLDHPYFSTVRGDGSFELRDLPPGDYVVEAWHERYPAQEKKISVTPSGAIAADFTFQGE